MFTPPGFCLRVSRYGQIPHHFFLEPVQLCQLPIRKALIGLVTGGGDGVGQKLLQLHRLFRAEQQLAPVVLQAGLYPNI